MKSSPKEQKATVRASSSEVLTTVRVRPVNTLHSLLGVKAVLVKSFARIHRSNLINAGILPLTFVNEADYDKISQDDVLEIADVRAAVESGKSELTVKNKTTGEDIPVLCELTGRTKDIILAGGLLDYTRESLK